MATRLLLRIYRRHIFSKSTNRNRLTSPFRGRPISDEGTKDLREIGERFWGLRKVDINRNKGRVMAEESKQPIEEVGDGSSKRPQFGARYLTEETDVFKHNAWDDVEWDEEQEKLAQEMVEKNSTKKFTLQEVKSLTEDGAASQNWDKFYGIHANRFFKDRNWLFTEFPELNFNKEVNSANQRFHILEVGCGVGNTVFPILETNCHPETRVFACDFSPTAVDLVKQHPEYLKDNSRCSAFVCDITSSDDWVNNAPIEPKSLDAVTMLFVLSAIDPVQGMDLAVSNVAKYLRSGGHVYFRDYGRYDLAQLRIKPGKCLRDNFYARGDGTLVYFFDLEDLTTLFERNGFKLVQHKIDRRLQVNRGKKIKMYRVWLQAKFQKL